jgi:hypothetical protein
MMSFQHRRDGRARVVRRQDDAACNDEAPRAPAAEAPAVVRLELARGWDASSLDLLEGLEVTEHASLDTLPAEFADSLRRR